MCLLRRRDRQKDKHKSDVILKLTSDLQSPETRLCPPTTILVFFRKQLTGQLFSHYLFMHLPSFTLGLPQYVFNLCSKFQHFFPIHLPITPFLFCFFIFSVSMHLSFDRQICFCLCAVLFMCLMYLCIHLPLYCPAAYYLTFVIKQLTVTFD